MIGDILTVSEKMTTLEDSVTKTKASMEEVTNGTNDTADSVQSQLLKTEDDRHGLLRDSDPNSLCFFSRRGQRLYRTIQKVQR